MKGWELKTLEKIVRPGKGMLVSGPFGSNISSKYFVEKGIPVIRGNNLTNGKEKFIDNGFVYITEEKAHELRGCEALQDDIIITAAGTLGQVGIVPHKRQYAKYIISNKQIRLRCNLELVDPLFVYYRLIEPGFNQLLVSQNKGSSIPLLTLGSIKWLPLMLPPLPTQRRIASILSAYDDLIENNLKRIKLLEELAQRTYEEWFVKFRINGVPLPIDEKTGLPVGWEMVKVEYLLAKIKSTNKIPSSEIYETGSIPVIDQSRQFIAGYTDDVSSLIDIGQAVIVFGDHTRILKFINFPFARGADGTQVIVSKNKRMPQHLFYHTLLNIDLSNYHYARHFKFLKDSEIVIPNETVSNNFEELVSPLFGQIKILRDQNRHLKKSRDILLPRLMSGKINVE